MGQSTADVSNSALSSCALVTRTASKSVLDPLCRHVLPESGRRDHSSLPRSVLPPAPPARLRKSLFAVAARTHAIFVPAPHSNGGITFHFAKNGVRGRSLNNWQ